MDFRKREKSTGFLGQPFDPSTLRQVQGRALRSLEGLDRARGRTLRELDGFDSPSTRGARGATRSGSLRATSPATRSRVDDELPIWALRVLRQDKSLAGNYSFHIQTRPVARFCLFLPHSSFFTPPSSLFSALGQIRTADLRFRKPSLYPLLSYEGSYYPAKALSEARALCGPSLEGLRGFLLPCKSPERGPRSLRAESRKASRVLITLQKP
jgi:hypothetical protein